MHSLLRSKEQQNAYVSDQYLWSTSYNDYQLVSPPMASGVFLKGSSGIAKSTKYTKSCQ